MIPSNKKFVFVIWNDARDADDTWMGEKDAETFTDIEVGVITSGWLIRQTPKYVTLGADYNASDNDYGRVTKIPVGMILNIIDVPAQILSELLATKP